jgi:isopenicillin-N N-acyltransferase like protein
MSAAAVAVHRSAPAAPAERGEAFGAEHAEPVATTVERYEALFRHLADEPDLRTLGEQALSAIGAFWPDGAAEVRGIAAGAGLEPWRLGMLNARTEVLAALGIAAKSECSTVVSLRDGAPVTMQTWDWHDVFADSWFCWTIEHPGGRVVHTVTEYGILGKLGVNDRGVGIHINILGHEHDGRGPIGVPVHVLVRSILDRAGDVGAAAALSGSARCSASSVLTLVGASEAGTAAVCCEQSPDGPRFVLPDDGVLLHTNHFLDPCLAAHDTAPRKGPDSYIRLDVLRRAFRHGGVPADPDALRARMASHVGGAGAICCHPAPGAALGDRWQTLATVSLDVPGGSLLVRRGGPCDDTAAWTRPERVS